MHACASSGRASSKRVDHHPSSGICLGVLPFENDFWTLFLVSLKQLFHGHCIAFGEGEDTPFLPHKAPPKCA